MAGTKRDFTNDTSGYVYPLTNKALPNFPLYKIGTTVKRRFDPSPDVGNTISIFVFVVDLECPVAHHLLGIVWCGSSAEILVKPLQMRIIIERH
jgi:hypothetical protein